MSKTTKLTFEDALHKLEDIVAELESDTIPLEKITTLYEEGISLSKHCKTILDTTENRIKTLSESVLNLDSE